MRALFGIGFCVVLTAACIGLERSPESGYPAGDTSHRAGFSKKQSADQNARDEVAPDTVDTKIRLKQWENQLSSQRDLDQYSKALPWFHNDEEKLDFFSAGGFEARQKWLNTQGFSSRAARLTADLQEVVRAQDIALGMPESLVKKSWGDPINIEVSGRPAFHNQRWHYKRNISTPDGFKTEHKIVYFEGGKVVGWESE